MTNPFAPATAPATAPANPFGAPATAPATEPANPFGGAPAATPPATTPAATPPPAGGPVDPFGAVPDAPAFDGLNSDDAAGAGTVVAIRITKFEGNVPSTFKDPKTGEIIYQDKLTVDAHVVTGDKAGNYYPDTWLFWRRVVAQFKDRVGDNQWYLVKLTKAGRAVIAEPITDPALRAEGARLIGAAG